MRNSTVDRPNVLLICCDHLRADWLGCNGHPVVMTPQIDVIAREGVNFQRAFSEAPVCIPARRILMTGMGNHALNMLSYKEGQPFIEGPKLAEVMTRAGYQTFAAGKLHVYPQRARIGFEDVQLNEEGRKLDGLIKDDYEAFLDEHGYGHLAWTHGVGQNQYGLRMSPLPERFTTTHWTAQKAMEFIERRDPTRPFFLYVSFDKPHQPITPPLEYYELYRSAVMPEPVCGDWVNTKRPSRFDNLAVRNNYDLWQNHPFMTQQILRGFAALITHIDSMIGVLLGTLREHGLLHNTLIIFTSDHGDNLFDHGDFYKSDYFRGSANIPFLVRPPKAWGEGHGAVRDRIDTAAPVALMDIMPTILDICGIDVPPTVEGRSVAPLLTRRRGEFRRFTCGYLAHNFAITDGRFKYMWFAQDQLELLFDLDADPNECCDLADDPAYLEQKELMKEHLTAWMVKNNNPYAQQGIVIGKEKLKPTSTSPFPRTGYNNRGRH
ncbi:MAG TPA: sulfatase-like hydrolase/transferase [Firmicutes bacterium]|nr:sulfatase-like hydrolase/transferase [Bacillota bacterium]